MTAHDAAWLENSGAADFTSELVFHPMVDPEMGFAEFRGRVDIVPTGKHCDQAYGGLFQIENSKIQLFREYFDPIRFQTAFTKEDCTT